MRKEGGERKTEASPVWIRAFRERVSERASSVRSMLMLRLTSKAGTTKAEGRRWW